MTKCSPNKIKRNVSFSAKKVDANIAFKPKSISDDISFNQNKISGDLCYEYEAPIFDNLVFDYSLDFPLS